MLGTPIWSDMWDPGPRLKNPSAIPDDRSGITNLYFLEKYPSEMDTSLKRTSLLCLLCCTSILYFFLPSKTDISQKWTHSTVSVPAISSFMLSFSKMDSPVRWIVRTHPKCVFFWDAYCNILNRQTNVDVVLWW